MSANPYPAISGDGGLVPPDLRTLVYALSPDLDGGDRRLVAPASFGLQGRDRRAIDAEIGQAWTHAGNHWRTFKGYRDAIQQNVDAGTPPARRHLGLAETRDYLLLPLLRLLGYDPEVRRDGEEVGGRRYTFTHGERVPHVDGALPIHLTTFLDDLDAAPTYGPSPATSTGGARKVGPHAAMQEFLNRRDLATYGVISNGHTLRLLAPNPSLTRLQYLEFDLESIFEGDLYPDFRLLWLLCHRTRLVGAPDARPPLDAWRDAAMATGTRAMAGLRVQVKEALRELGTGFVTHPRNQALRAALRDGTVTPAQFQSGLLTVLYRLLFLFVAEARGQLHPSDATATVRDRYADNYGLTRLRTVGRRHVGDSRHADLWLGFDLVCTLLGDTDGSQAPRRAVLGLPALGGLFARNPFPGVDGLVHLANAHFATAIHHLSVVQIKEGRGTRRTTLRRVNYADLDVEELGGIYEGLLELVPQVVSAEGGASFAFAGDPVDGDRKQNGEADRRIRNREEAGKTAGGDRKQSGSYYTPRDLVGALVTSTLDPVIEDRLRGATTPKAREAAILGITVCDPACGSGHFLLAAAERLAGELASVRADGREPSVTEVRQARRDVIAHCLYGVDLNPMAVDLCKVALWMAGYHSGTPLGFLDHRIRCGNSLVGASPDPDWLATMAGGVPPEAFGAATDPAIKVQIAKIKKANRDAQTRRAGRQGRLGLFGEAALGSAQGAAAADVNRILDRPDDSAATVVAKSNAYAEWVRTHRDRLRAPFDAWVAAFFWPIDRVAAGTAPWPPLSDAFGDGEAAAVDAPALSLSGQREIVADLAARHRFFHWPIEFPEVFARDGATRGGFDCILGNPPWDQLQLDPGEYFATRVPEITAAPNMAARERLIGRLAVENPHVFAEYARAKQDTEALQQFMHDSGRFPLGSVGRLNLAPLFVELCLALVNSQGRAGVIVPTGISTDSFTQGLFRHLVDTRALATLFDFENMGIFEAVHNSYKFCLLSLSGSPVARGDFAFFLHDVAELRGDTGRRFQLSPEDFALINPNTRTCPTFRTRADADLTRQIYRDIPVLVKKPETDTDGRAVAGENPWGVQFMLMFMMNTASHLFRDAPAPGLVPLYEGKMIDAYNHRFSSIVVNLENASRKNQPVEHSVSDFVNPDFQPTPASWLSRKDVLSRISQFHLEYFISWKNITASTNHRSLISAMLPFCGVGHSASIAWLQHQPSELRSVFFGILNSLVLDYFVRTSLGNNNLTLLIMRQLPVPAPNRFEQPDVEFIVPRVVELTYTAWDLRAFAADMGMDGAPFRWDEDRRAVIRAELDAWYAMKYGLTRKQLRYVLDPHQLTAREIETLVTDDREDAPDAPRVEGFPGETFRVLKDRENRQYGEFRTARLVMAAWDALAKAGWDPSRYASPLAVPPGDARARHAG